MNDLTDMVGNKKDYSCLWAFLILFSAVLNIAVRAAVFVPVSKVQLLTEAESEIKLAKRSVWDPEERTLWLHLLRSRGSRRQERVKRYDRNAYRNWKPGDPDPFADTQAERDRKYNAYQANRRREKEANRRHKEERDRLNAFVVFCRCSILNFYFCRSNAWMKEVEDRRKNRTFFSWPIIVVAILLGCCVCCGAYFKCKNYHCSDSAGGRSNEPTEEEMAEIERWRLRIHGPTTTNGSSTQGGEERRTSREGASPPSHATAPLLMPEKIGTELPPSYATAVLEDEKVAELDKRLDQQKEVIDAQNARLAEQEAKLAEMSRRLVENEQMTAVADSTF